MFLERLTAIRVCLLSSVFCFLTCGGGSAVNEGESEAEGECTAESCDDGVECTDDSRNEETCECAHTALHARCLQGQICDLENGCVSPPPCGSVSDCPDPDDPCVIIGCESSTATCTYNPLDRDGDGHAPQVCVSVGGDDCDDSPTCDPYTDEDCDWEDSAGGSLVYPGAEEICDEKDNDCNGVIDDLPELGLPCDGDDGDQCAEGVWECWYGEGRGLGCSDNTSTNREICNGEDDDCDGETDEDWPELGVTCDGADGDLCEEGIWVCDGSGGVICNDITDTTAEIFDGIDNDCDSFIDELGWIQVSAGGIHTCGLRIDNTVVCWGNNGYGQSTPPSGTFIQVSAGQLHTCGVKTDNAIVCWGDNGWGKSTPPSGTFTQVSAGGDHTCGVRTDSTVACWGQDTFGQSTPPSGTFTQVSAGGTHTCGLRTDNTIDCWESDPASPSGTFTQVSAGTWYSCGVRTDNTVTCWGVNDADQSTPPSGTFTQVSAGAAHTCGVRTDNTIACWGSNSRGCSTPPLGTFVQVVSAGESHTCGLSGDNVVCWGDNSEGQSTPPTD